MLFAQDGPQGNGKYDTVTNHKIKKISHFVVDFDWNVKSFEVKKKNQILVVIWKNHNNIKYISQGH